jgi:unsaturated rhamnogalacturonyl hydrolase
MLTWLVSVPGQAAPPPVDWGRAVVDATLQRYPDPERQPWAYQWALFLYGQHLVHRRTQDVRYLDYLKRWGAAHVQADGTVVEGSDKGGGPVDFATLDAIMPGRLVVILHERTGEDRYRLAAARIRARFATWPRTRDGGLWHAHFLTGQLWADGAYMAAAFLLAYGQRFPDGGAAHDEAALQLEVYGRRLQDPESGLLHHAYSEPRDVPWADPETGLSPEAWCRANGWYGMALVETLEVLPVDHPRRAGLLAILGKLVAGLDRHQDPRTGRWFEVIDQGAVPGNWVETSCSAMHAYVIARAVQRGWVGPEHQTAARQGFQGVLATVSLGADGLAAIEGTVVGTKVGDLAYYLARPRQTNNRHGLGAFLILHEQQPAPGPR